MLECAGVTFRRPVKNWLYLPNLTLPLTRKLEKWRNVVREILQEWLFYILSESKVYKLLYPFFLTFEQTSRTCTRFPRCPIYIYIYIYSQMTRDQLFISNWDSDVPAGLISNLTTRHRYFNRRRHGSIQSGIKFPRLSLEQGEKEREREGRWRSVFSIRQRRSVAKKFARGIAVLVTLFYIVGHGLDRRHS